MIATGGVLSGTDIFHKLARGASAVQIYTALVYRGPWVVGELLTELTAELRLRGFGDVSVSATLNGAYVARLTDLAPGESRLLNAMVAGEKAGPHAGFISVTTPLGTLRAPAATFVFP